MFWKRNPLKRAVPDQETSLESRKPSESQFPKHIINGLLGSGEVYIGDTPLEEPVDEPVNVIYEGSRRRPLRYGDNLVVSHKQLRARLLELLTGPTQLLIYTPGSEPELLPKVDLLKAYDPSPESGKIDFDLPPHLKERVEYGQSKADLIVCTPVRLYGEICHRVERRVTRDILPPPEEIGDEIVNKMVRNEREYNGVPIFVDMNRGYTMPLTADRHYASVVEPLPSKN